MPAGFEDQDGDVTIPIKITLTAHSWGVFARAARDKGWRLQDILSGFLDDEAIDFEDRGFLTHNEAREERDKPKKSASPSDDDDEHDAADWWKNGATDGGEE